MIAVDRKPPPPVINSARVLSYAFVEELDYRRRSRLYNDDRLVEKVPRLAICVNLGQDIGPLLLHCDADWNVLGTAGASTVDEVKSRAERNYPGVAARWIDINVSVEEALRYYDEETGGLKCSFCGKRPFEIEGGWVEGKSAIICRPCIDRHHDELHESDEAGPKGGR